MTPKKPTFIIIGSAKCGTTTLASILDRHPDCCFSRPKEVSYFQDRIDFKPNPNYFKGWDWYQQCWNHYNGERAVGEATPSYSDRTRSPSTARRIHHLNPEMKIIYLVRHPLKRQMSAWQMDCRFGTINAFPHRIETRWAMRGFDYWMCSQRAANQWAEVQYDFQLDAYREYFSESNILVSILEDWHTSLENECSRIANFIGCQPTKLIVGDPSGENRAEHFKVERKWVQILRKMGVLKLSHRLISSKSKIYIASKIALKRIKTPKPKLSQHLLADFRDFVREDNIQLLTRYGKSQSLWDGGWNCVKT